MTTGKRIIAIVFSRVTSTAAAGPTGTIGKLVWMTGTWGYPGLASGL